MNFQNQSFEEQKMEQSQINQLQNLSEFERVRISKSQSDSRSSHSHQKNSETSSLINEDRIALSLDSGEMPRRKRIILRFPDGTYSHALQFGDSDSWLEMKIQNENNLARNGNTNRIQILQIEDEIEYIINNIDFMLDPETAMKKYNEHRRSLILFIAVNLIFEISLYIYLFRNMDFIVTQLSEIYRDLPIKYIYLLIERLKLVFKMSNGVDVIINAFMYSLGYCAIKTHQITIFNAFHWLLMVSIFSRIVISYLNILNLLMFIMKIALYLYSRYVLSILYSVLLIPNPIDSS